MKTSLLVPFALILLAGCSGGAEDSTTSASTVREGTWLAGHWSWTETEAGDTNLEIYELDVTGSATHETYFRSVYLQYGDTHDTDYGSWSVHDDELTLFDLDRDLVVTPNCRLLQLDDKIFSRVGQAEGCPYEIPALSEAEAEVVGSWEYEYESSDSRVYQTLTLEEDRAAYFSSDVKGSQSYELRGYWSLDDDGTFHGIAPDATELMTTKLRKSGSKVLVCGDDGCTPFKAK